MTWLPVTSCMREDFYGSMQGCVSIGDEVSGDGLGRRTLDRWVSALFEGTTWIDEEGAIRRGSGAFRCVSPGMSSLLLRWAIEERLVEASVVEGVRRWTLLRHEPTFVKERYEYEQTITYDVRSNPQIAWPRLAGMISRELRGRERERQERQRSATGVIKELLSKVPACIVLPDSLQSLDLPPVESLGALGIEFHSYSDTISCWRAVELATWLSEIERTHRPLVIQCNTTARSEHLSDPFIDNTMHRSRLHHAIVKKFWPKPNKTQYATMDMQLDLLFGEEKVLEAEDIVRRSLALYGSLDPEQTGYLLRWARNNKLVRFERYELPQFEWLETRTRYVRCFEGIAFVGLTIDNENKLPTDIRKRCSKTQGSVEDAVAQENSRRLNHYKELEAGAREKISEAFCRAWSEAQLPEYLLYCTTSGARTVGELESCFESVTRGWPIWRLVEALLKIECLANYDPAPADLNDFDL